MILKPTKIKSVIRFQKQIINIIISYIENKVINIKLEQHKIYDYQNYKYDTDEISCLFN
jgi:hypothetical protein